MARVSIRKLVLSLSVLMSAVVPGARPAVAADRPNIVFILVDDLRFDDLGYAGHPFSKTPNVDRLAAEGLTFANAFATTPLCSPSRASFLTGLHANAHGITDNTDRSPADSNRTVRAKSPRNRIGCEGGKSPATSERQGEEPADPGSWTWPPASMAPSGCSMGPI